MARINFAEEPELNEEENENSVLKNILITPIQSSMNIVFSFLITCAYSLISLAISYSVFNKRDF